MESHRLNPVHNYIEPSKNIQEVRVNAEELAASFPESTRFDKPPSSLININSNAYTNTGAETAFFPIENTPTLEPITDSITGSEIREKEELRIHKSMQGLANMKLRAEVPYFKQQELETNLDELKAALHQKEEHLKMMGTSFRNLQRTYNNRFQDYEQRVAILDNKNKVKATVIKILCPLILLFAIAPFLFGKNQNTAAPNNPMPMAKGGKDIIYLPPEKEQIYYIVKPKDTLSTISKKFYGNTKYASTIFKINHLNSYKLKVGEKLIITELDTGIYDVLEDQ